MRSKNKVCFVDGHRIVCGGCVDNQGGDRSDSFSLDERSLLEETINELTAESDMKEAHINRMKKERTVLLDEAAGIEEEMNALLRHRNEQIKEFQSRIEKFEGALREMQRETRTLGTQSHRVLMSDIGLQAGVTGGCSGAFDVEAVNGDHGAPTRNQEVGTQSHKVLMKDVGLQAGETDSYSGTVDVVAVGGDRGAPTGSPEVFLQHIDGLPLSCPSVSANDMRGSGWGPVQAGRPASRCQVLVFGDQAARGVAPGVFHYLDSTKFCIRGISKPGYRMDNLTSEIFSYTSSLGSVDTAIVCLQLGSSADLSKHSVFKLCSVGKYCNLILCVTYDRFKYSNVIFSKFSMLVSQFLKRSTASIRIFSNDRLW